MATTGEQGTIPISFGAEQLAAAAAARREAAGHPALCLNHWLLAVIERAGTAEGAAPGTDTASLRPGAEARLAAGDAGPPLAREALFASAGRARPSSGTRS